MKFCSGHLHDLNAAIKHKGMGSLIRPERTTEFAQRWLEGSIESPEEFDPLVVSVLEVNAKAQQILGHTLTSGPTDCPLCLIDKFLANGRTAPAASWIDNVTDLMLLFAKVNQLVK